MRCQSRRCLAAQFDQNPAQRRWIVNRVVAAADRSLAVLVYEVKDPSFIALEVEQQPVCCLPQACDGSSIGYTTINGPVALETVSSVVS